MEIRTLGRDDIREIKELWQGLNEHHRGLSTHFKRHFEAFTFTRRVEQLTAREELIVFLAVDGEDKIGYCVATSDRGQGEIDSLYIKPENRGAGLGGELMSRAMDWLTAHECEDIRITIAAGNEEALPFYRKYGFVARFTVMQRMRE